jgi:hypothetical protein
MAATPIHGPGAQRRFARQLREAALRATGTELLLLEALETSVRAGDLCVLEASHRVRRLIHHQHTRLAPRDVMPLVPQATATRLLITNTTKLVAVAAELRKASDEKRRLLLVQADRLLDERQELRGR